MSQTYVLGRRTRRYAVVAGLSIPGMIITASMVVGLVILLIALSSAGIAGPSAMAVLALGLLVVVGTYVLIRHPMRVESQPLAIRLARIVREWWAERTGPDAFTRSEEQPLPAPVGHVLPLAVSPVEDGPEVAVIRHGQRGEKKSYFSVVLEIEGRGDGIRSSAAASREDRQVDQLLVELAEQGIPVDQLSMHSRAMPGLDAGYQRDVITLIDPSVDGTLLGNNMRQKLANLSVTSDLYRTYAVLGMPEEAVLKWARRHRRGVTRDAVAMAVHEVTGRVAERLDRSGFAVQRALGPRRLGALMRHLYAPSWGIDELSGITAPVDGFQPYPQPTPDMLRVPDWVHDAGWWHCSGDVPPWGWPSTPVRSRWMEPIVTQLFDPEAKRSVTRMVTASWRLMDRRESHRQVQQELYRAAVQKVKDRGKVTTGEDDQQHDDTRQVRDDLANQATGVKLAVRLTVSARSPEAALDARDLATSRMAGMGVSDMRWYEHRQDAAMLLGLPLGRGW